MSVPSRQALIDSHIHLWDPYTSPRPASPLVKAFGWNRRLLLRASQLLTPAAGWSFIGKADYVSDRYLCDHYQSDIADIGSVGFEFVSAVHVEASWKAKNALGAADETRWLEKDAGVPLHGIVGAAELDHPQLSALLDQHQKASTKFVGVRDKLAWDPRQDVMSWARSPSLLRDKAWIRGLQQLGQRQLSFDAWAYAPQLQDLHHALSHSPDTATVLCHIGTPINLPTDKAAAATWRRDLERLAALPQLRVKLSGMTMPIVGWNLHETPVDATALHERLAPHYRFTLDTFGPDRCLFGSNFPMDKVSASYRDLLQVADQVVSEYGRDARNAVFHDNAAAFYAPKASTKPEDHG